MAFTVDRSRTIITALILGHKVSALDVAWLRREVFAEGPVSREAADELFAVERAGLANAPEWTDFFVEMIAEHVVRQAQPAGIVGEAQAKWLIERADECASANALATLAAVLAEARRAPAWFLKAVRARAARGWPEAKRPLPDAARPALVSGSPDNAAVYAPLALQ